MNEEEIKKKLTAEEYHVLREKGTEATLVISDIYGMI